jgi:hypothetical protein
MADANPNLDPWGKLGWEVLAFAYSDAISFRVWLTFFIVGLPIFLASLLPSSVLIAVSLAEELIVALVV